MTRKLEIPVEGMRCEGCARTLQLALEQLDGVRDATADFERARVQVRFDPARVDEQRLRARIQEAGYEPVA